MRLLYSSLLSNNALVTGTVVATATLIDLSSTFFSVLLNFLPFTSLLNCFFRIHIFLWCKEICSPYIKLDVGAICKNAWMLWLEGIEEYLSTTRSNEEKKRKCQLLSRFRRKRPCLRSSVHNPTVYCGRVLNNSGLAHDAERINSVPPLFWLNLTWTDAVKFTSVGGPAQLWLPDLFMVLSCKCWKSHRARPEATA